MVKNILLGFASIALAVASAASSYNVTFYEPVMINGSELKPGDYKLELKDKTAVIKQGKTTVEATVTVQNAPQKFNLTSVGYVEGSDSQLRDVRLAGTTLKLSFDGAKAEGAAAGK